VRFVKSVFSAEKWNKYFDIVIEPISSVYSCPFASVALMKMLPGMEVKTSPLCSSDNSVPRIYGMILFV